jgi:RHS repeat-associated protein
MPKRTRRTFTPQVKAQVGYLNGDVVDEVFAQIDSNGISWLGEDHLGSVAAVFDNTGHLSDSISYDGWGNVTSETHPGTGGSLRYAGYSWDSSLGLYHAGARWYDPRAGRWMSQDPLGFDAGDSNLYRYVNNNPISGFDPSGMVLIGNRETSTKDIREWLANSGKGFFSKEAGPGITTKIIKVEDGRNVIIPIDIKQVQQALKDPRWTKDAWTKNVLTSLASYDYNLQVGWAQTLKGAIVDEKGRKWNFYISQTPYF